MRPILGAPPRRREEPAARAGAGIPLYNDRMTKALRLAASLLLAATIAFAAGAGLEPGGAGIAREVIDGDTLVLEMTATAAAAPEAAAPGKEIQIRLVGIQAPKLPLGREGFAAWPLAQESKDTLAGLALGKTLTLSFGGRKIDRHGRLLAHLYGPDGTWIQGEMLRRGLARVYTFPDNRALAGDMLALEREARARGAGIWGDPFYAPRTPESVAADVGTFQLVEGVVKDAARVRARSYLNFGEDWRTDFTVVIGTPARKMFEESGVDIISLSGRRVRVRGWVQSYNGPMIEATHPEQIEVLE